MKKLLKYKETNIVIIFFILCIALSFLNPVFLKASNLMDVITGNAVTGILAIGMTLVIITGGIDVSVAGVTTAVAVITGNLLMVLPDNFLSIIILFIAAPIIGIAFGAINGLLIAKIKIPPIVVTLGTMSIIEGLVLYFTNGNYTNSTNFPTIFLAFADFKFLGISVIIYIYLILAIVTWLVLKYTLVGRSIYALGGNERSSVRVGINTSRVQLFIFSYMGMMAGFASIVQTAYTKAIDPNGLLGLELTVIAAVVLGGANIMGGRGTIFGTVFGTLLLGVIQNGLILAHIQTFWQDIVVGAIILIAVSYDHIQYKRSQSKFTKIEVEA
jgi:simple sugar transport system permease protein